MSQLIFNGIHLVSKSFQLRGTTYIEGEYVKLKTTGKVVYIGTKETVNVISPKTANLIIKSGYLKGV